MLSIDELDDLIDATGAARQSYFATLGEFSGSWTTHENPRPPTGLHWPTRPGWQRISNGDIDMIASSGLSDPWYESEEPNIGLGVEIILATRDSMPDDSTDVMGTWFHRLALGIAADAVRDAQYRLRHERFGLFLIGMNHDGQHDGTASWICDDGGVGLLLGVPIPNTSMSLHLPAGTASLVTAKLLTPNEYEFAATNGPAGAAQLADLFASQGSHHLSSLERESVV